MRLLIILLSLLILVLLGVYLFVQEPIPEDPVSVSTFEECAALGYPILESYPRRCVTPGGQTFVEDIGNALEKQDFIFTDTPRPNDGISSPLTITGQARGTWFFEASFPITLYDSQGNTLGTAIAQAQGEWMTENFVPFEAELSFEAPLTSEKGTLVLHKDNPSGLPEYDDELRMPVRFE